MTNPQKTKRHHFVPECYLKHFVTGDCLYTLDIRKVQKGFKEKLGRQHPGGICYSGNYHKIETSHHDSNFNLGSVGDDLFIEHTVLRTLENKYDELFTKLTHTLVMSQQETKDFCNFLLQLKLRNPYHFEHTLRKNKEPWMDAMADEIYQKSMDSDSPFQHVPAELKKTLTDLIVETNKADVNYEKKLHLFGLVRRFSEPTNSKEIFYDAIINCRWLVMTAPEAGPYFITSDNPGFSHTLHDDKIYNTKFTGGFYFNFPLSPKHCLVFSDFDTDECYLKQSAKTIYLVPVDGVVVVKINDMTIQRINLLLIASDEWCLTQIEKLNKPVGAQ